MKAHTNTGGKGSARRPTDLNKFSDNWDRIFGKAQPKDVPMVTGIIEEDIPKRHPVQPNTIWLHVDSQGKYTVVGVGEMQVEQHNEYVWVDSVTYRSWSTGKLYTRALNRFLNSFVQEPRNPDKDLVNMAPELLDTIGLM